MKMGMPNFFPGSGEWGPLIARAVGALEASATALTRQADIMAGDVAADSQDPIKIQLGLLHGIHGSLHTELEEALNNSDQFEKSRALRRISARSKQYAEDAMKRLKELDEAENAGQI